MKSYKFKAVAASGELVTGVLQASDALALNQHLSTRGLSLLSYRMALSLGKRRGSAWTRKELINFIFHLEQMLTAGIPMLEALREFGKASEKRHQVTVVDRIVDEIDSGQSLSGACAVMPETFSPLVVSMLEAGEQSGSMETVLQELGELLKWQEESISRLRRVLIYPAFVAVVLFVVVIFVMTWLVPGMVSFISSAGATLPWHTRALIGASELITDYWAILMVVVCVSVAGLKVSAVVSPACRLFLDRLRFRFPLIGPVMLKTRLARFSRCTSMMYSAGISIVNALQYARGTLESRAMEVDVDLIKQRLIDGQGIASSFRDTENFPPLVARILKVGESTGALDTSFNQLSYVYDRESKELTEKLEQSLGPIMTVIVGLIMMWVVISVIGPIYDLVFGFSGGLQ
jgi:type IV pilus assembly protein PilC